MCPFARGLLNVKAGAEISTVLSKIPISDVSGALFRILYQIRSHSLVFANHAPAASLLPHKPTPEQYFVLFAKLSDDEIASEHKSKLLVRKLVTDKLLRRYGNNIGDLYQNIPYNHSFFGEKGEEEIVLTENSTIADENS